MAPMTRFFASPRRNEGSKAKANRGAGYERRRDQLKGVDTVHGSGISACSVSLNNPLAPSIFPIEAADLRPCNQLAQLQVAPSEVALSGAREEAKAGQRTRLDVPNAPQALVNVHLALVSARHDRIVESEAVLNGGGRLSPQVLNLATTTYDPSVHYQQVRDSWFGMRAPDGR